MKKEIKVLCFAALLLPFLLVSCEIPSLPKSVRIKANPKFGLPIGSVLGDQNFIEDIIDPSKILEEMNGGMGEVELNIFDYIDTKDNPSGYHTGEGNVQTYLISSKIQEYPLDVSKYMEDVGDFDIPPYKIPGELIVASQVPGFLERLADPIVLDLTQYFGSDDMWKWVGNIEIGDGTELVLEGQAALKDSLYIEVPQFGIDKRAGAVRGDPLTGDLVFRKPDGQQAVLLERIPDSLDPAKEVLKPGEERLLANVYVVGSIPGEPIGLDTSVIPPTPLYADRTIGFDFEFVWESLDVYPGDQDDVMKGEFKGFDISEYLKQMGGAAIGELPAYLYLSGTEGLMFDVSLKYKIGEGEPLPMGDVDIDVPDQTKIMQITGGPEFNNTVFPHVITSPKEKFNLAGLMNAGNATLLYSIDVPKIHVENNASDRVIRADLAILLPLRFEVPTDGGAGVLIDDRGAQGKFTPLNIPQLDDLLGNTDSMTDSMKEVEKILEDVQFQEATVKLTNIVNKVTSGLYLGVAMEHDTENPPYYVVTIEDGGKAEIPFTSLSKIPKIKVLSKVPDGQDVGVLSLQRMDSEQVEGEKKFDFRLAIEARFALNQGFSFEDLMSGNIGFGD
jgi:hypothetical protein